MSSILQGSCIFRDDKNLLRRIAYQETSDGAESHTFRRGYHGGIWKVDKSFYDAVRGRSANLILHKYFTGIKNKFHIDIHKTRWEDLRKPLFSALVARLFIVYKSHKHPQIPSDITGQGNFWKSNYRQNGDVHAFVRKNGKLMKGCHQKGVDLVFVIDDSSSVGSSNFKKMIQFCKDVVSGFNISPTQSRIGVLKFSYDAHIQFHLKSHLQKGHVLSHIGKVSHGHGNTHTEKALKLLREEMFQEKNGARPQNLGIPRVAIVLTDGKSSAGALTVQEAKKVHEAGITVYSVGVGKDIDRKELQTIASQPVCQNAIVLEGFSEFAGLKETIQDRACDAPIIFTQSSKPTDIRLVAGGQENFKVTLNRNGLTLHFGTITGRAVFYISRITYPNEAYYDEKIVINFKTQRSYFFKHIKKDSSLETVFGKLVADREHVTHVRTVVKAGDHENCAKNPCRSLREKCVDLGENGHRCDVSIDQIYSIYIL